MLFLTFDGLRNAKVRDRDTRIKIALQGRRATKPATRLTSVWQFG
jgi:hypothetical protein